MIIACVIHEYCIASMNWLVLGSSVNVTILLDFSLTVKTATLIFISGCGSAISSAKEGNSGFIYNSVKRNKLFEPR